MGLPRPKQPAMYDIVQVLANSTVRDAQSPFPFGGVNYWWYLGPLARLVCPLGARAGRIHVNTRKVSRNWYHNAFCQPSHQSLSSL